MTDADRPDRPVASGLVMGRYRLEERLGLGGSAEVWRGVDERLGRPVAIKLLHPHLLPDEAARARFEREARAAAGLSHPGIVAVYDVEATDEGAAIVLELVEGEALSDRLAREGPLPPAEAARIAVELAEALQHAHERGVVHRDVKPGNVLIDAKGRARLVDFGIARVLEAESARVTTAGEITGTLRYLAPEQLAGGKPTAAADIYALGIVLFEMLAGRPAFDAPTPVALVEAQRHPPAEIDGAPPELAAIAFDAMRPDPAQRPVDAGTMAARLREWLDGRTSDEDARSGDAAPAWVSALQVAGAPPMRTAGPAPEAHQWLGSEDPTVVVPIPGDVAGEAGTAAPETAGGLASGAGRRSGGRRPSWLVPTVLVGALAIVLLMAAALAGPGGPVPGALFGPSATFTPGFTFENPSPTPRATETPEPDDDEGPGKGPKKTPPGHSGGGRKSAISAG